MTITNFEDITYPLTDYEKTLVPIIIRCMEKYKKANPIKGTAILSGLKAAGHKVNNARVMKVINHIRGHHLMPIIATSKGYYSTDEKDWEEIRKQIQSLEERIAAQQFAMDGLSWYLPESHKLVKEPVNEKY